MAEKRRNSSESIVSATQSLKSPEKKKHKAYFIKISKPDQMGISRCLRVIDWYQSNWCYKLLKIIFSHFCSEFVVTGTTPMKARNGIYSKIAGLAANTNRHLVRENKGNILIFTVSLANMNYALVLRK